MEQVLSTLVRDERYMYIHVYTCIYITILFFCSHDSDITEKVVSKLTSSYEHIEHIEEKLVSKESTDSHSFIVVGCCHAGLP